ncbi:MAG TPA: hypothetical protein QF813_05410 [Alphaproteobacteria bacterium]|nr:hypothetical protein [Alphaproteobacteria bacterium]
MRRPLEQVYFSQARTLLRVAQAEASLEYGCHAAIGTIADAALPQQRRSSRGV